MGFFTRVEDRPTPKCVYNWRVWFCAAVASFASVMIGYDSAFIGTTLALPSFTKEFNFAALSPADLALVQANIVSVYQAGAFFGSFFAYPAAHFLGRQRPLVIFAIVFTLGAGMMLGASAERGLGLIYAGRVLAGIGVGGASMLTPIYIAEISPPAARGSLVGIYELGWQIGGLVGFWINYGVNLHVPPGHNQWLIPFAVQLIPAGGLLIGVFFVRESPRWLLTKGRREEALRNLCWIRQLPADDIYMVEEVAAIDAAVEYQRTTVGLGFWQPFKAVARDRKVQWRFFLGGMMFLWQNASGINAINYYSPTVFKSIGIVGTNTSFLTTGIFGVIKTSITLLFIFFLIEKVGRRKLLLIGASGGSLCMWYLGAYIKISNSGSSTSTTLPPGGISAMFFFYLWTVFYSPTWNPIPWILNSEIFQPNVRPLGQAFAAANNWFWNFIVSRFTPQMFLTMKYGVYFFFAALMIMSVIFVYFFVPETKSIPLEAMDKLFETKPVSKANKIVLADLRLEDELFRQDAEGAGLTAAKEKIAHIERHEDV